ncbi:tRNA lysidine(34) synthetase TilS [Pedobacter aquae]|uniref:tRNA(Ile)-lysidine synthase n=1 Tax=Pedobacter aquae TaxID=2605747 RepID=A0A5C0VGH4_9SPHI|nr:tRNA lysidine(34) synthetase TilS [Pedobacter aquae]QEK51838.1 tRNA lysidine(34) synthetase TilS [Pedobacter aquae]
MLWQLKSFQDFIKSEGLIGSKDTVLLAVSGGKDSVAMAHLFKQANFSFAIAHCNFQLRGTESDRDEQFVAQLAKTLEVPFHVTSFNTLAYADEHKISTQMAARDLRYRFFEELVSTFNYQKIAVAQHQNDAIETVILNLTRGTGIAGLHGIKTERQNIIRPLMLFKREDIDAYILANQLDFVEDSSNSSTKYIRNKIRHQIIPVMKEINPSLEDTFQKNIAYFSDLEAFLKASIQEYKQKLFQKHPKGYLISIQKLKEIPALHFILTELLLPYGFNSTTVTDVILGLDKESGKTFFGKDDVLLIDRDFIFLQKIQQEHRTELTLNEDDLMLYFQDFIITQEITETTFSNSQTTAFVDTEKLKYPLALRTWQEGDKFMPLGMKGFKKLSDFFISLKIPLTQKHLIPVLVNADDHIIWIAGYRLDERFKITADTKKITKFELKNIKP